MESVTARPERPFWSLLGSTLSNLTSMAMIVAGTAIGLGDKSIVLSATAKAGADAGQKLHIRTSFK